MPDEDQDPIDSPIDNDTSVSVATEPAPETPGQPADSSPSDATPPNSFDPPNQEQSNGQSPAGAKPVLATDPHKEFNDFKAQAGRERAAMQRQIQEFQQRTQTFEQAEQKRAQEAERLKLKRWETAHPEHHKFGQTMAKRSALQNQLQALKSQPGMTDETFQGMARALTDASLSPDEQAELQEHHQMNQEFLLNPVARTREEARQVAQEMIREAFGQLQQHGSAVQEVQRDLGSIPPHALPAMKEALESGMPYEMSMKYAQMAAENHDLKGRQDVAAQRSSQSAEQLRLSKSQATVTRDPKPAAPSGQDIYNKAAKIAKEQGISTADPKFPSIYTRVEAQMKQV